MTASTAGLPGVMVTVLHRRVTTNHPRPPQPFRPKAWAALSHIQWSHNLWTTVWTGRQRVWRIPSSACRDNSEA